MKKYLISAFTAFITHFALLPALIVEAPHFSDIYSHVDKDTIIVLDIDDTLLIPEQMLGCDVWFCNRIKHYENGEMNSEDALEKALAEWQAIRHITAMEIVEPDTDRIVGDLQAQGYDVIGLTTQGLALATRTKQQLNTNGIDLKRSSPIVTDQYFNVHGHGVLFRDGILFTSATPKGEAFFKLCDQSGYTPKRIVFINDKDSHLADLEKTAKERNVEFIGLRYSYSDAKKRAFDPEIADYQFKNSSFYRILSDDEAREHLKPESKGNHR